MAKRFRIGIDLDGVVAGWQAGASRLLNKQFGLSLLEEHPTYYYSKENTTKEQWAWLWNEGVTEHHLFLGLDLMDGVYDSLEALTDNHDVYLLTTRPEAARADTFSWIAAHLRGIPFAGIQFFQTGQSKGEFDCDAYIDDSPDQLKMIKADRPLALVVMRELLYNKDEAWTDRVSSLAEFAQRVKEHKVIRGDPRFTALLKEIDAMHTRKQADYGSDKDPFANVRASEEWGIPAWVGALVRLNDKIVRLKSFARRGTLANESAEDSLVDVMTYAGIATVLYREAGGKK